MTPTSTHQTTDASTRTADTVTTHTLLNCLIREMSSQDRRTTVSEGHLLLRLPRRDVLLRAVPRRISLIGAQANLLLRWSRQADRHAGYVPLPSPLGEGFLRGVTR